MGCPRAAKKRVARLSTSVEIILAQLMNQRLDYSTLAWRAHATYLGTRRQIFTLRVHIQADSLVWASAGLLGLEGARCLLRRDSAFVLMRLQKRLYLGPVDSLWQRLPLSLGDIVDLLIGRWPMALSNYTWRWDPALAQLSTSQQQTKIQVEINPQTGQILRWQAQLSDSQMIELRYTWKGLLYPAQVEVFLPNGDQLRLSYMDFQVNPTDLRFPMGWSSEIAHYPIEALWR